MVGGFNSEYGGLGGLLGSVSWDFQEEMGGGKKGCLRKEREIIWPNWLDK